MTAWQRTRARCWLTIADCAAWHFDHCYVPGSPVCRAATALHWLAYRRFLATLDAAVREAARTGHPPANSEPPTSSITPSNRR